VLVALRQVAVGAEVEGFRKSFGAERALEIVLPAVGAVDVEKAVAAEDPARPELVAIAEPEAAGALIAAGEPPRIGKEQRARILDQRHHHFETAMGSVGAGLA